MRRSRFESRLRKIEGAQGRTDGGVIVVAAPCQTFEAWSEVYGPTGSARKADGTWRTPEAATLRYFKPSHRGTIYALEPGEIPPAGWVEIPAPPGASASPCQDA